jgi:hypothetical protein
LEIAESPRNIRITGCSEKSSMPVKRRTPKGRQFVPSDELLDLYHRARVMEIAGLDREPSPYSADGQPTAEYLEIRSRIRRICDFRPWNESVLDVREGDTSAYAARGLEIKPIIEAALKERRRRARSG